jgi:hypothetical protein
LVIAATLFLAGCNLPPPNPNAPPLVLSGYHPPPPQPIYRTPGATMTCQRYGDTLNCY